MDANKIDQHLNAVLRAAGSELRHYSLPKSLEDMRAAMKAAVDDATSSAQARIAELEAERAEREMQKPAALIDDDENFQGPCRHATAFVPMHRGTPLYAAPPVAAPARLAAEQAEKADEAIREALGSNAFDCVRAWSAWEHGTMSNGDFWLIAESDERVAEIRNAAAAALGFEVGK